MLNDCSPHPCYGRSLARPLQGKTAIFCCVILVLDTQLWLWFFVQTHSEDISKENPETLLIEKRIFRTGIRTHFELWKQWIVSGSINMFTRMGLQMMMLVCAIFFCDVKRGGPFIASFCWWLKSCTTKDDDYPIIYRVLTIPGGAGFQPSTVVWLFFGEFHGDFTWPDNYQLSQILGDDKLDL